MRVVRKKTGWKVTIDEETELPIIEDTFEDRIVEPLGKRILKRAWLPALFIPFGIYASLMASNVQFAAFQGICTGMVMGFVLLIACEEARN